MARDFYAHFAELSPSPELREFWLRMSAQEAEHAELWNALLGWARRGDLPDILDNAAKVDRELAQAEAEVQRLLDETDVDAGSAERMFLAAFWAEFYVLHPALCAYMRLAQAFTDNRNAAENYGNHITAFLEMAERHGFASPEFHLLTRTLLHLWKQNRELVAHSATDALTGVLSRRAMADMVEPFCFLAARAGHHVGMLMIDIDGFKELNDEHGHLVGDHVLMEVAHCLKDSVRRCDLVGRFGGDEFLICLTDTRPESLSRTAERIRQDVQTHAAFPTPVTVSIGGCCGLMDGPPDRVCANMIERADVQLRRAKTQGKNVACLADQFRETLT